MICSLSASGIDYWQDLAAVADRRCRSTTGGEQPRGARDRRDPTLAAAMPCHARRWHLPSMSLNAILALLRREAGLFTLGVAVIAIHVVDDSFLQPQPGTSAGDHLVSGLVPLALLALAAWAYPRLRGGRRGALALAFGVLGIAAGGEAFHYARTIGASGDDYTGLLAIPAGLLLLGLGVVTLWRTRRAAGGMPRRYLRRSLLGAAGVVVRVGRAAGGHVLCRDARGARGRAAGGPRRRP